MCGICNQLFSLPSTLDKHMYVHLNKSFTCETCGIQFSFLSELEYDKTVHKTIASYVCVYPKCKKLFMQEGDLTLHAQIHDKFTSKCNDCKWTTTCQKYLKAHIDEHFEELKYSCNLCEERFEQSQNTVLLASTQAVYKATHSTVWAFAVVSSSRKSQSHKA